LHLASDQTEVLSSGFFEGKLLEPGITARCLRTVSDLVGTRFYIPPSMLERILREADPVVTVTRDVIRFEGFSSCCSTYVRHDLTDECYEAVNIRPGTTNVDFGADMRATLARITGGTPLQLAIQRDAVVLRHLDTEIVERKVPLPVRWIKGFAEVQTHLIDMEKRISFSRVQTQRFLRSIPRSKADHEQWILPTNNGARLTTRKASAGVMIRGAQRLHFLEKLAAQVKSTEVWFNEQQGSSAWILDFDSQRITFVLNSEPWRGFSGDGSLLSDLALQDNPAIAAVRAQLNWQSALDPGKIAENSGHSQMLVDRALSVLAAQGFLGFDLTVGAYFHRVLPFDLALLERTNPRLKGAMILCGQDAVEILQKGTCVSAVAHSGGISHRVSIAGTSSSCTCPWYAKHKNARGPCKHILATEMTLDKG